MRRESSFSSPGAQKASRAIRWRFRASISASKVGMCSAPPVVGEPLEPQPREHLGALLRPPAFGVEGDDAPGDEVVAREELRRAPGLLRLPPVGASRGRDQPADGEHEREGRRLLPDLSHLRTTRSFLRGFEGPRPAARSPTYQCGEIAGRCKARAGRLAPAARLTGGPPCPTIRARAWPIGGVAMGRCTGLEEGDLEDYEYPDEPDDDDDDDETIPCPHCREPVYEDAERCPNCGKYLSREDAPRRRPWWLVLGAFVCLGLMLQWVFWWWSAR